MTSSYWPSETNIAQCIRAEAEELSEHILLAVHEPMQLEQRLAGESIGEKADEKKLLKHLIETERPIPIIGDSGVGKSHIIRWLNAQLKLQKNDSWHIIRIPKNASLRQVLVSLLDGLEGEVFEQARTKVNEVSETLKTQSLADLLVVFIGDRLETLFESVKKEREFFIQNSQVPDEETKKRWDIIKRHAKRDGLPALLGDSDYKKGLVDEDKCLYLIAKRLTSGSTTKELENNNYTISASDLDFTLNLADLSLTARNYVLQASLNTNPSRRQEATDLLNEVLSGACGGIFSQLFQLHGGGFQELFVEIRKYLYEQGKVLFILVEDMAAISAIEDILIDSLMQEGIRDGVQELCSLHSAIAVTDGYIGYTRRRNTLATRAKSEWFINKVLDSEEETYQRIENFCGRYLNIARYGEEEFQNKLGSSSEAQIWESEDDEERLRIECFERSDVGFSLFPYNKSALKALADKYCRPHDELEFNPRKILNQILLNVLPNFRQQYTEEKFPPAGLFDFKCSTTLSSDLTQEITDNLERVKTAVAIWGYGAHKLTEVPSFFPAEIAKEFSLEEFSDVLQRVVPSHIERPIRPIQPKSAKKIPEAPLKRETTESADTIESKFEQIEKGLDTWFDKKNIPQEEANVLRKIILKEINNLNFSWYGIKKIPNLKRGKLFLIHIPYNKSNPEGCLLQFATEEIFSDEKASLPYREFILAVLRRNLSVGIDSDSWDYQGGYDDYCRYINFLNIWLPEKIQKLVQTEREKSKGLLKNQLGIATAFDPIIGKRTPDEKINMLVRPAKCEDGDLHQSLEEHFPATGLVEWDDHLENLRVSWSKEQVEWLGLYSINRHALEADLIKKELKGLSGSVPTTTSRCAQSISKSLNLQYKLTNLLESCSTEKQFQDTLENLYALVEKLSDAVQFHLEKDNTFTAKKFLNLINKIKNNKDYWITCNALLSLRKGFNDNSIKYLSQIDLTLAEDVKSCLLVWDQFYRFNIDRMKFENSQIGGDKREADRKKITQHIKNTKEQLKTIEAK